MWFIVCVLSYLNYREAKKNTELMQDHNNTTALCCKAEDVCCKAEDLGRKAEDLSHRAEDQIRRAEDLNRRAVDQAKVLL